MHKAQEFVPLQTKTTNKREVFLTHDEEKADNGANDRKVINQATQHPFHGELRTINYMAFGQC